MVPDVCRSEVNSKHGDRRLGGASAAAVCYLGQPVAVQDRPVHGFLFVYVREVLQSNHVNVLISPAPLFVLHKPVLRRAATCQG